MSTAPRRIGLLGATGYTGRLTAKELVRRGLDVRLGARSAERLASVDATSGSERVTVDTSDPVALQRFFDGLDVVINTVGPFTLLGRPVVDAAVAAGVHYVDSTGEPGFMQDVYDAHASAAVAVVPAAAYDFVPGELAAAVAAADLGVAVERMHVGYVQAGMRASRGTARSALEAIKAMPDARLGRGSVGERSGVSLPWGETVMVPRWAPGADVEVVFATPAAVAMAAPVLSAGTGLLRASMPLLHRLVDRLPDGPDEKQRSGATATITATASGGGRSAAVTVRLRDVYHFTAVSLVECALRAGAPGKGRGGSTAVGALTPAQAFEATDVLDALAAARTADGAEPLLSWQRGEAPRSAPR